MSEPSGIGVLALQGAVGAHTGAFASLGVEARAVRAPADLEGLSHLVLPGGESTTLHHLLELFGLRARIVTSWHAGQLALMGTCAGAILLGQAPLDAGQVDARPPRWGLLDAEVDRNAYGRQVHSSHRRVAWHTGAVEEGVFIRAPRFTRVGPSVRVLAQDPADGAPVLVTSPGLLAATYHPELGGSLTAHRLFLEMPPLSRP